MKRKVSLAAAVIFSAAMGIRHIKQAELIRLLGITAYTALSVVVTLTYIAVLLAAAMISAKVFADTAKAENERKKQELLIRGENLNPLEKISHSLKQYLETHNVLPNFEKSLKKMIEELPLLIAQQAKMTEMVEEKFGTAGLTPQKFLTTLNVLINDICRLGQRVISDLEIFDAVKYQKKIDELLSDGKEETAAEYQTVLAHHEKFIAEAADTVDKAAVSLGRQMMELQLVNEKDMKKAAEAIEEMNNLVNSTIYYR